MKQSFLFYYLDSRQSLETRTMLPQDEDWIYLRSTSEGDSVECSSPSIAEAGI